MLPECDLLENSIRYSNSISAQGQDILIRVLDIRICSEITVALGATN